MSGRKTTGARKSRSSRAAGSSGSRRTSGKSRRSRTPKSAATATATRRKPRRAPPAQEPLAEVERPVSSIVVRTILPGGDATAASAGVDSLESAWARLWQDAPVEPVEPLPPALAVPPAPTPARPTLQELFSGKDRQSLGWLAAGLLLGLLLSWIF